MRIKTAMHLGALFPILLGIVLCCVLIQRSHRIHNVESTLTFAGDAVAKANELSHKAAMYAVDPDHERWKDWRVNHAKLGTILAEQEAEGEESFSSVGRMKVAHRSMHDSFRRLALTIRERPKEERDTAKATRENTRIVNRIRKSSQDIIDEVFLLSRLSHGTSLMLQQQTDFIAMSTIGLIAILMTAVTYLAARQFTNKMKALQDGLNAVADGQLTTKVTILGNNEIAQLSDHFNHMTDTLLDYQKKIEQVNKHEDAVEKAKLSNEQLSITVQKLESTKKLLINREKSSAFSDMASGIIHDFNDIVTAILSTAEFMESNPDTTVSDDDMQCISEIKQSVLNSRDNMRRLSQYLNTEESKHHTFDIVATILDAVSATQPRWKSQSTAKGQDIHLTVQTGDAQYISGDKEAIFNMMTQLIFNAIESLPSSGGYISVIAENRGKHFHIEIHDSGKGMSQEARNSCFAPFYTTKQNSVGLGMTGVKATIDDHDGTIDIKSNQPRGTIIMIDLPIRSEVMPSQPDMPSPEELIMKLNILLADDDHSTRRILKRFLERDGHTVAAVENGKQAIDRIKREHFELILSDQAMPEMNGTELAESLSKTDPNIPFILLTGFGDLMNVDEAPPTGVDYVLSKPVTMDELKSAIVYVYSKKLS